MKDQFSDIIEIIKNALSTTIKAVNSELISLYWNIGEYISKKVKLSEWGNPLLEN